MIPAMHVSLRVRDLARSVDFYRRLFGEPAKVKPGYAKFVAQEPPLHLAVEASPLAESGGALSHLGIRVGSTEEVLGWKSRLAGRGLQGSDDMGTVCCYALQDKFWLTDPDGNRWEVYTVLEDVGESPPPRASACCAENCCAEKLG